MGCRPSKIRRTYIEDTSLMTLQDKITGEIIKGRRNRYGITLMVDKNIEENSYGAQELNDNAMAISQTINFDTIHLNSINISKDFSLRLVGFESKTWILENVSALSRDDIAYMLLANTSDAHEIRLGRIQCPESSLLRRSLLNEIEIPILLTSVDFGFKALKPELMLQNATFCEEKIFNGKSLFGMLRVLCLSRNVKKIEIQMLYGNTTPFQYFFDEEERNRELFAIRNKQQVTFKKTHNLRFVPLPFNQQDKEISFVFLCPLEYFRFYSFLGMLAGVEISLLDIYSDFYGNENLKEILIFVAECQIIDLGNHYGST